MKIIKKICMVVYVLCSVPCVIIAVLGYSLAVKKGEWKWVDKYLVPFVERNQKEPKDFMEKSDHNTMMYKIGF